VLDGVRGQCEPEGYCSYPDDDCDGGSRFEARAPGELAGRCVDPVGGSGSGTDTSGSGSDGESTGPGPQYVCPERPCEATGLVVGEVHSCVLDGEDALWCWGGNEHRQLGQDITSAAERCPRRTVGLGAVAQASAARHVCALDVEGNVSCWGDNRKEQVDWRAGVGEVVDTPIVLDLAALGLEPEVIDVGPTLSCAAQGTDVRCWGEVGATAPVPATTPTPVRALAAGEQHACALIEDPRTGETGVVCIGDNSSLQLGVEAPIGDPPFQQSQPLTDGALLVDSGYRHTCAVVSTAGEGSEVRCWGANDLGQSGSPPSATVLPMRVSSLLSSGYTALALGSSHSCALADDGLVECWGDDGVGQVSPIAEDTYTAQPVVLEEGAEPLHAVEIGAGQSHTCARTADGGVVCWGANGSLQLGAESSVVTRAYHWIEIGCE
jgi:alpha-tubulin suppressor-like RCC1 family protein